VASSLVNWRLTGLIVGFTVLRPARTETTQEHINLLFAAVDHSWMWTIPYNLPVIVLSK